MTNKELIISKIEDIIPQLQTVFDESTLGDLLVIQEDIKEIIKKINILL